MTVAPRIDMSALVTVAAQLVMVFAGGQLEGQIDAAEAARRGLTLVDLSDAWTPAPFVEGVPYRETLIALANDLDAHAREDVPSELYGIVPSFATLRARLADEPRHACHDAVDDAALAAATLPIARGATGQEAVRALQEHLACEGLLAPEGIDGRPGGATTVALRAYRQRHMIPAAGALDAATRAALVASSRELDFRALLRALRERVVDATRLIEDGSAAGAWGQVLGRDLDAPELRDVDGWPPLARAAPDLVSPATEAAARALGWTSPEDALAAMARMPAWMEPTVALPLPAAPAYDRDVLALHAEIDRGDVVRARARRSEPVERRASLVLWVDTDDGPLALIRWPTTIGGWQKERTARGVVLRYKESPAGDFVWRDVVVAPAWFPPPTTPDAELVRRGARGPRLRQDTIGPGYRSAYGLVMLMHHQVAVRRGVTVYEDTAVRTHGSVNYGSVRGGTSHGCHRLYNHLALRLAAFVLRHRPHDVVGMLVEPYVRRVDAGGKVLWLRREERGYGYRLREPVPVTVLPGR